MINNLGFYVYILILVIGFYLILIYFMKTELTMQQDYLNKIHLFTQAQLKSEQGRLYRYQLIKNISVMKKYLGISLLLFIISLIGVGGFIFIDSRQYFKEYFEVQRTKLNLRNEESVDSLLNVISTQKSFNDSLNSEIHIREVYIESFKKEIKTKDKVIKTLSTQNKE